MFDYLLQAIPYLQTGVLYASRRTSSRASSSSSSGFDWTDLSENADMYILVLIFLVVFWIVFYIYFKKFVKGVKMASMEKKSLDSILFEIRLPKNNEVEIQSADQMFSSFLGISRELSGMEKLFGARLYISFEIVAFPDSIRFYINVPRKIALMVEKSVNGAYPLAEIIYADEYNIFHPSQHVAFAELKLAEKSYIPIRTYEELAQDSLSSITSIMSKLRPGEAKVIQIVCAPADSSWRASAKKYVKKVRENNADPEKSKMDVEDDTLASIEKKAEKGGFQVDIRLVSVSPDDFAAEANLDNMIYTFDQFAKQGGNKFEPDKGKMKKNQAEFIRAFLYRFPEERMTLNTAELATIFHFPNANITTPNIHWTTAKRAPAAADVPATPKEGSVYLGTNEYRGIKRPVYIYKEDRRRHMYYIGKTGSGKTVFMQHMIYQDILNGNGLAFLDPHGDAVEWLLDRIPPERVEDVIYINPADIERPIGMNIMEWYTEQDKHMVVNGFLGLMQKMFDPHNQGITGPRFEQSVRNTMLTVMSRKGTSLSDVMRLLQNDKLVEEFMPYLDDEVVKRYWTDQIANTQEFHKSEVLGYIVSKFDRFITNKLVRNIISQPTSGFDFRQAMDSRKIILVNLSKGTIGEENSQFLGLLLIPKMVQAAMSRANIDQDLRQDFFLYVDEFQNFATPEFAVILSEARKYRLNLVVANQYISQMTEEIRNAVFGNAGSIASFKVGVNDAQYLANEFSPVFDQDDIINLENFNLYIKLLAHGEYTPSFSMKVDTDLVFKTPPNKEMGKLVKEFSRLKYGRDRKLVEAQIKAIEEGGKVSKDKQDNQFKPMPPSKPPMK